MGLLLPVLACIIALVLPCLIVAASMRQTGPRRAAREASAISIYERAPVTDRLWFKLCAKLLAPLAGFALLVLLIRNVQNGIGWNGASWAVIVPFGLVLSVVLLSRVQWE